MNYLDKNDRPIDYKTYIGVAVFLIFAVLTCIYFSDNEEVKISINKLPYTVPLDSPSPGFIAKLNDTISVREMVKCLSEVKNDSDLILLSQYINSENASAFCKGFKIEHKPKKGWFERDRQNTVAEFINKDLEIGPVGKTRIHSQTCLKSTKGP